MPSFFVQKKTLLIEIVVLIAFLGGCYYAYTFFTEDTITTTQANDQLLTENLTLFLKAMNQDRISFNDITFMQNGLVKQLRDYSETIYMNETRGRSDPFTPYASSRSIR